MRGGATVIHHLLIGTLPNDNVSEGLVWQLPEGGGRFNRRVYHFPLFSDILRCSVWTADRRKPWIIPDLKSKPSVGPHVDPFHGLSHLVAHRSRGHTQVTGSHTGHRVTHRSWGHTCHCFLTHARTHTHIHTGCTCQYSAGGGAFGGMGEFGGAGGR